jgi:enoyl-CoA hydratase/carnithine racemase
MVTQHIPSESDAFLQLTKEDDVFILTFLTTETRFSVSSVSYILAALDIVEKYLQDHPDNAPKALITTATGRIYSNGLELSEILTDASEPKRIDTFFHSSLHRLFARLITFPIPTVACINGHAFAAGFFFALCHDFRIMREDRGYLCMNEVELPLPMPPGVASVLKAKIKNPQILRDVALQAKRLNSKQAMEAGIVDLCAPESLLLESAKTFAKKLPPLKSPLVYQLLKKELFSEAVSILSDKKPYFERFDFNMFSSKL